jgi:hypothetical protein
MSKRLTIHAAAEHAGKSACGLKDLMASRLSTVPKRVTCNRCRAITGTAQTWAQKHASTRKPPKRVVRVKHSDLVALDEKALGELKGAPVSGGDYPGVTLIDSATLRALKECDTDPRKFPLLRIEYKGYPSREVPNPIYVPPSAAMVMPYARAKTTALNRGLDALLGRVAELEVRPVPEYMDLLEAVHKYAVELCNAVDAAEEDIGGHRPAKEILGDLGPATEAVDSYKRDAISRRVQDENEG